MEDTISVEPTSFVAETEPVVEQTVTPTEPQEPAQPAEEPKEPEQEMFELPDGRKVDASTLSKEWKENFYPEYTRKSQELAQVKQTTEPTQPKEEWIPQSYEEIIEKAKQEVFRSIQQTEQERIEHQQRVETEVATQLESLKKIDPGLNENALFQHAMKYKFTDLQLAHQNMKDMNMIVKNVQETTAKNIAKRQDPVSIQPGAGMGRPDPSQFSSASEYYRSITK